MLEEIIDMLGKVDISSVDTMDILLLKGIFSMNKSEEDVYKFKAALEDGNREDS